MTSNKDKASNLPLMTEPSRELIKRYISAYNEYFVNINSDCLLAMIVHPLLGTHGFEEVSIKRSVLFLLLFIILLLT